MTKTRIAIFSDVFLDSSGGIVTSIRAQKEALEKAGHKVVVFSPGFSKKEQSNSVYVVPTCKMIKPNNSPLARRPKIVEKWILEQFPNFGQEFDIVHVHYEAGCSIAGVRLAKKYKIKLIQTMHGREDSGLDINIPHPFKNLAGIVLERAHALYLPHQNKIHKDHYLATTLARAKMWTLMVNHANNADVVLTPSEHFAKKLKHYGVNKKIISLSNGIDDALIAKKVTVRHFSGGETLRIIWNSRVSKEKRIMEFLRAIKLAHRKIEMDVYGDGNVLKQAKKYVERHKLMINFLGAVPNNKINQNMQKYHISAVASNNFDTQSMTLLEAQAAGLPVIFCDPDMCEVVPNGAYVMAENPSSESMAKALVLICDHPEMIQKMSEEMIKKRFDVAESKKIIELLNIYTSVLR